MLLDDCQWYFVWVAVTHCHSHYSAGCFPRAPLQLIAHLVARRGAFTYGVCLRLGSSVGSHIALTNYSPSWAFGFGDGIVFV